MVITKVVQCLIDKVRSQSDHALTVHYAEHHVQNEIVTCVSVWWTLELYELTTLKSLNEAPCKQGDGCVCVCVCVSLAPQ